MYPEKIVGKKILTEILRKSSSGKMEMCVRVRPFVCVRERERERQRGSTHFLSTVCALLMFESEEKNLGWGHASKK